MSVCIAAKTGEIGNEAIVLMTDRKVANGDFSNEDATLKCLVISPWLALFAGNDVSPSEPLADMVRPRFWSKENTYENIVDAFESSYQDYLSRLAMAKVIGRWQFKSMEEFREKGRAQFGEDVFDSLCNQIDQVKLQCTFLVAGFDESGRAHIFTVRNPGYAENRSNPGYFAIGNGAFAAMSTLSFYRQSIIKSLEETIYNVCAAKFMAESASDVGTTSFGWLMTKDGNTHIDAGTIDDIHKAWLKRGQPRVPAKLIEQLADPVRGHLAELRRKTKKKSQKKAASGK